MYTLSTHTLTQDQTAWDMFLSFHMGVTGLVARPRVDRPTGNSPAIPDGTLHLTTKPFEFTY